MKRARAVLGFLCVFPAFGLCGACAEDERSGRSQGNTEGSSYVLGSVVIDADDGRTTYLQVIKSIEAGHYTNESAIEVPGNGTLLASGKYFFAGLTEEPTWVRYSLDDAGGIVKSGRLSLLDTGAAMIDYGNAIVDEQTAVSVLSNPPLAVVWNPSTMEITGQVDLSDLTRDGYELEVWTTIAHDGLVYIPGRWADWDGGRIYPGVSMTIFDPKEMKVVGRAEDHRCASGGRPVFAEDGYAYVMGDGRTYSIQMFAHAKGEPAPENCLLRIAPGETRFDPDFFYAIPSITGGLDSITEIDTNRQGSGYGFAKMFYPDRLPEDVKPDDFEFWDMPAHKMWRITLADPPVAEQIEDIPFSAVGFDSYALDGLLYTGETADGNDSDVYSIDPETRVASKRFSMDGYFYGLYELSR